MIKEAIILAGGLGLRLRSAVPDLPKCLAPVAGKPFLAHLINYLMDQEIEKFIFALGYKNELVAEFIQHYFSTQQVNTGHGPMTNRQTSHQLSIEKEPLGTGGAIRLACSKATQETVLIVNGDTFFRVDLAILAAKHQQWGGDCTLTLKPMQDFDRYGTVQLNADHTVNSFEDKKHHDSGLINGGIYALNKKQFLENLFPEQFSFEEQYLEQFAPAKKIFGLVQDGYFVDIGVPKDYERAQKEMLL
jgi:D-glycero-alpha-D-manno-heptose 1-phosphate guanylyltransferase